MSFAQSFRSPSEVAPADGGEKAVRTKVPTSTARSVSAPTRPISEPTSSNRSVAEYGSFGCNGC
jgi:hypothetical protein